MRVALLHDDTSVVNVATTHAARLAVARLLEEGSRKKNAAKAVGADF
jgi:hypothetical protein